MRYSVALGSQFPILETSSGAVLLAESHLAIHTWPERRGVTLDVYVCNFTADNTGKLIGELGIPQID